MTDDEIASNGRTKGHATGSASTGHGVPPDIDAAAELHP